MCWKAVDELAFGVPDGEVEGDGGQPAQHADDHREREDAPLLRGQRAQEEAQRCDVRATQARTPKPQEGSQPSWDCHQSVLVAGGRRDYTRSAALGERAEGKRP